MMPGTQTTGQMPKPIFMGQEVCRISLVKGRADRRSFVLRFSLPSGLDGLVAYGNRRGHIATDTQYKGINSISDAASILPSKRDI